MNSPLLLDPSQRADRTGQKCRRFTWQRVLKYLAVAVVAWLLLSFVLFLISAH